MNESRSGEGECRSRGALLIVEAMRTQAHVAVLSALKPRKARGSVLAFVVHAAVELHAAVVASPGKLARLCLRTVAGVGRPAVFTPATVLTGLALTFINVHLTQLTWRETTLSIRYGGG